MKRTYLLLWASFFAGSLGAQNLLSANYLDRLKPLPTMAFNDTQSNKNTPKYLLPSCFLPEWKADNLPAFCKLEHQIGKGAPMAIKFRLGSVDYVDWLEGKRSFGTFAP